MDKQPKSSSKKYRESKDTNENNAKRNNELAGASYTSLDPKSSKTSVLSNNKKNPLAVPKNKKESRTNSRRKKLTDSVASRENSENDVKVNDNPIIIEDSPEACRTKSGNKESKMEIAKRKIKRKPVTTKIMINPYALENFQNSNSQLYQQTQNERDAISSSTLFSNIEKRTIKINNYSPILVDTILLQKLTRLDQTWAKKLIFNIVEYTNNTSTVSLTLNSNSSKEITVKTKRKSSIKKMSVKKFLISEIYNLLYSRLTRDKDRLAEILYHLLVKMCLKKKPKNYDDDNNVDIRRIKNKIKEYTNERNEAIRRKLALREGYGKQNGDDKKKNKKVKGRHKSSKKQKSNKLEEESGQSLKIVRSKVKMSKHDLLRMELLSVGKEQMESTIRDYLLKQTNMNDEMAQANNPYLIN